MRVLCANADRAWATVWLTDIYVRSFPNLSDRPLTSTIARILTQSGIAAEVTERLRQELRRFIVGGIVRSHLPQTWWFVSESGAATFYVDQNGAAVVYDGQAGNPDVTVTWSDAAFNAALVLRDRSRIPAGSGAPSVVAHTGKGQRAFAQVRSQLGL